MEELKEKYREILRYLVCGLATTMVNLITFWIFVEFLKVSTMVSTLLAWFLSAAFAYYANKAFVFKSKKNTIGELVKEGVAFFEVRILSGIFETIAMVILIDYLHAPKMWMKLFVGIVVTILNYIASKIYIFQKVQTGEKRWS